MAQADPLALLRARAIRLLARRELSRAELRRKLARPRRTTPGDAQAELMDADATRDMIERVLDQLEASGLLSDARAADSYVRGHANRFGRAMLDYRLRQRGITEQLIDASLAQEEVADEASRALNVWRGRFQALPADSREWARQARFLQNRGFASELIRQLLTGRLATEE